MNTNAAYERLILQLDDVGVKYRLIDHDPEGQTDLVSQMRGHDVNEAAKCIVMMAKLGRKTTSYVLCVVPGDRRVSLSKVKGLLGATYIGFASKNDAERVSGSVAGTILPFSFDPSLRLIVDPSLSLVDTIFFNAARLDRSIALKTEDYMSIAKPLLQDITE